MSLKNPYEDSQIIQKINEANRNHKSIKIAFIDIDSTITGEPSTQVAVRQLLESQGYIVVFVTARTSEMCMSLTERNKSSMAVQKRPLPKLKKNTETGKWEVGDPAAQPHMNGLIDPDIIAATNGAELLIKQSQGGYEIDEDYLSKRGESSPVWRSAVKALRKQLMAGGTPGGQLSEADQKKKYLDGYSVTYYPPYRIELDFASEGEKENFAQTIQANNNLDINLIDESDHIIEQPLFRLYLMPRELGKKEVVDHLMKQIQITVPDIQKKCEILIAGDAYADLEMGLYAAKGCHNDVFIIPGEAKLGQHFIKKVPALNSLLEKLDEPGLYRVIGSSRKVIIGDEMYPDTEGAETILDYLKAQKTT